jgi:hypothetical protein
MVVFCDGGPACRARGRRRRLSRQDYETLVQKTVRGRRMICMCSYSTDQAHSGSHLEVMEHHDLAVPSARGSSTRRRGANDAGDAINPVRATDAIDPCESLERRQRTFDLALIAADMGTWRYTLADNVCVYDANAQRLYGLTEARFLHDEEGVKAKFHPDDMDLMWSRVAETLDPTGTGHYDVEYR